MAKFVVSNAIGMKAEAHISQFLSEVGILCTKSKDRSFDLILEAGNQKLAAEVKFDHMARKTGNIALEFWNSRQLKPSGICATKAHLWFMVLGENYKPEEVYVATASNVLKLHEEGTPVRDVKNVGDGNAWCRLFSMEEALKTFVRIDNMDQKTLVLTLNDLFSEVARETPRN